MAEDDYSNAVEAVINLLYLIGVQSEEPETVRTLVALSNAPIRKLMIAFRQEEKGGRLLSIRERVLACLKAHRGTPYCAKCIARELGIPLRATHRAVNALATLAIHRNRIPREKGRCGGPCGSIRLVSQITA